MRTERAVRGAWLLAAAGLLANVAGVFLARAFRNYATANDVFVVVFVIGNTVMTGSSVAAAFAQWCLGEGIGRWRRAAGALAAASIGIGLWYLGLYWPWVVFPSS